MKRQPFKNLMSEMRAVARSEIAAPADAAAPSVESAEALLRSTVMAKNRRLKSTRPLRPEIRSRPKSDSHITHRRRRKPTFGKVTAVTTLASVVVRSRG